ncbi:MAG: LPS export ABC transporter periplasmic protein LptC [Spirochaetaceae bacterium 4572_7]|nr:MAG: LPS export ABC transporter periplasmic protein LptC [Spirochaetaceae bacterium 4572_7]
MFFAIIFSALIAIFFLFEPMNLKEQKFDDVPLFELTSFTLHELNRVGLQTVMTGNRAVRYEDRYSVANINYTDNSKEYIANMRARHGLYKDEIVELEDDVIYSREDGFTFETSKVVYDKKTTIAVADADYVSYQGENIVNGSFVKYNNSLNRVESKNVTATYQLKAR